MMTVDPRILTKFEADVGFPLLPHLIVLARVGSHSHGTYLPPTDPAAVDDVDFMGFVVPPLSYHLGLQTWEHWTLQVDELDVVLYSLSKAVRLLLKSNPNIVGMLWLRPVDYVYTTRAFEHLRNMRTIFSSQLAAEAFAGYAHGQLKRMEAFDLGKIEEYETLTASLQAEGIDTRHWLDMNGEEFQRKTKLTPGQDPVWTRYPALQRLRALHRNYFSGYMGAKRKATVRALGYDAKNAAHLIRLLRMGLEFLETGELQVFRWQDAEELKAIKRGEWSLDDVKNEADYLFNKVREAKAACRLPVQPNAAAANDLLENIQMDVLHLMEVAVE